MSKRKPINAAHAGIVASALVLLAGGCTGSGHKAQPRNSPTASSPTASTPASSSDDATEKALAAYRGMWSDFAKASDTANWQDPALSHHATEEALAEMVSGLYSMKQKGLVTHGAPVLHPQITDSTATTVDIRDCTSTTAWLAYIAATDKLQDNVPGGNRLIQADVALTDGVWRVVGYTVGDLGSC